MNKTPKVQRCFLKGPVPRGPVGPARKHLRRFPKCSRFGPMRWKWVWRPAKVGKSIRQLRLARWRPWEAEI